MDKSSLKKVESNVPKVLNLRKDRGNSPLSLKEKPLRVKNLKDAKKLLSRLLVGFQRGEIESREAKDLAYLLSVFVQVCKDAELEERIQELENAITKDGISR